MLQSRANSLTAELEACNQKTETKCTGIRKEVSKALAEQRQQLLAQTDGVMKKIEAVSAKVQLCTASCRLSRLCSLLTWGKAVQLLGSLHVPSMLQAFWLICLLQTGTLSHRFCHSSQ